MTTPFIYSAFWRSAPEKVTGLSVRRPSALAQVVAPSSNQFTDAQFQVPGFGKKYSPISISCRIGVDDPSASYISFYHAGVPKEELLLEHPVPLFETSPILSVDHSALRHPDAPSVLIALRGRPGITVMEVDRLVSIETINDKWVVYCNKSNGVRVSQIYDWLASSDCRPIAAAFSPHVFGELVCLTQSQGGVLMFDLLSPEEIEPKHVCLAAYPGCLINQVYLDKFVPRLQGMSNMVRIEGETALSAEAFNAIEYSIQIDQLFLAGRRIWALDFCTKIMCVLFPVDVKSANDTSDETSLEDYGFTALRIHPSELHLLAAISAVTHSVFFFDSRTRPFMCLLQVPAPDYYGVSMFHHAARWTRGEGLELEILELSPPTTFASGPVCSTFDIRFHPSAILQPRGTWAAEEPTDEEQPPNPFSFCVFAYCPWLSHVHQIELLLRGHGDQSLTETWRKMLLRGSTVMSRVLRPPLGSITKSIEEATRNGYMATLLPKKKSSKLIDSQAILNHIYALVEEQSQTRVGTNSLERSVGYLDADFVTELFNSWDPTEDPRMTNAMTMPYPQCGCGLVDGQEEEWVYEYPEEENSEYPDLIGPRGKIVVYQLPTLDETEVPSSVVHLALTSPTCEGLMKGTTLPKTLREPCRKITGLCCAHYVPKEPCEEKEYGAVGRPSSRVGIMLSTAVIDKLKAEWKEPPAADSFPKERRVRPRWLNIESGKKLRSRLRKERDQTLNSILSSINLEGLSQLTELAEGGGDWAEAEDEE